MTPEKMVTRTLTYSTGEDHGGEGELARIDAETFADTTCDKTNGGRHGLL